MTDLDAKQSSRWVDPMFIVASLILVVVGGVEYQDSCYVSALAK